MLVCGSYETVLGLIALTGRLETGAAVILKNGELTDSYFDSLYFVRVSFSVPAREPLWLKMGSY